MSGRVTSVHRVAIIGTVGVPSTYGGFETLAENLVHFDYAQGVPGVLTVYCSAKAYEARSERFLHAGLVYLPLGANGAQSIPYDIWSMVSAVWRGHDRLLLLGVSGAVFLPILRLVSRARVITNIDGIEWRREKWKGAARRFLRFSEKIAVLHSDIIIADNVAIAEYVEQTYSVPCEVIAYGGDHALDCAPADIGDLSLPNRYALSLCRIEPENNVEMVLEAFAGMPTEPLVFVGNWANSAFGRELRTRFGDTPNICLLDPIYDPARLRALRDRVWLYAHGHSAGGTNPSLVEMMHFDVPVAAFDCNFNRHTTECAAHYFESPEDLCAIVEALRDTVLSGETGAKMGEIARRRYTWQAIGEAYFELIAS